MDATTKLSPVSNKEKKKMKGKNRLRKDTNRKMIKRCKTRTNRHGSEGEEKEGRWSELPYEILDMIVKRIYFIDLINLRAVCKAWHYPFDSSQTLRQIPWLMIFFENNSCKLIDPAYKRTYIVKDTKIEEKKFYDMEVHDSKCGWILMSSSQSCQTSGTYFLLYSPFLTENNVIELPVLNSNKFHLATFSCAPSVGTTQHDYVLLAFSNSVSGGVSISICRRGDHTWRTQHHESYFPLSNIKSVVYSLGLFYCPSSSGSIGIFIVDRDEWVVLEQKQQQSEQMMECFNNRNTRAFLLKSDVDGEFLLVLTWVLRKKWSCPKLVVFRLYRSEMIWQTLDNLDDRAWFIMRGSSVAMELPKWKGVVFFCLFEFEREVMYSKLRSLGSGRFGKGYFCSGWHNRLYPCTKLYGSFGGQLQKQIWLNPSW